MNRIDARNMSEEELVTAIGDARAEIRSRQEADNAHRTGTIVRWLNEAPECLTLKTGNMSRVRRGTGSKYDPDQIIVTYEIEGMTTDGLEKWFGGNENDTEAK